MDIITRLNWVDILSVIIIIRISYVAFSDGLSHEIYPLVCLVITAAVSVRYYPELALLVRHFTGFSGQGIDCLALFFIIVGLASVFRLSRILVDALIKVTWHPLIDKVGGLTVGVLKASIVISLLLGILMLSPFTYFRYSISDKSFSGPYLLKVAPGISSRLAWALPVLVK